MGSFRNAARKIAARIVQTKYHNDIYPTAEEIGPPGGYGQAEEQEIIVKKVKNLVKTFHMDKEKDDKVPDFFLYVFYSPITIREGQGTYHTQRCKHFWKSFTLWASPDHDLWQRLSSRNSRGIMIATSPSV